MITDLDSYIERRAAQMAAAMIEAARADADARIAEAQFDLHRRDDLIEEMRRRLAMQDCHLADYLKVQDWKNR
jgi:hypothetical protein